MPNKLTDAEVKKALECCGKDDCDNCPNTFGNCYSNLARYALDLINRQEAEVESLKEELKKEQLCNLRMTAYSVKAEAYKECIEKVKEKSCKLNMCNNDVVIQTDYQISGKALNNLLNELVGDGDEKRKD